MSKLPPEVLARIEKEAEEHAYNHRNEGLIISTLKHRDYKAGAIKEAERAAELVDALDDAKHSLQFPDELGWGRESIRLIDEALRRYRGETP